MNARLLWSAVDRRVRRILLAGIRKHFSASVEVREITVETSSGSGPVTTDLIYPLEAPAGTQGTLGFMMPSGMAPVRTLRTLTRNSWGRFVDAKHVIAALNPPGKHGETVRRMLRA